jgi:ribosome biogenesis GTPase
MTQLEALGYGPFFSAQLELLRRPDFIPARIATDGQDRFPLLGCQAGAGELSGRLRLRIEEQSATRPVVGDWVALTIHGEQAVIHEILERRTQLTRRAAGSKALPQTIAANVDVYFVVTAIGRDLNARRLERYLAAVWDSGATPVVVINKVDQLAHQNDEHRAIEDAARGVPVIHTSAANGIGIEALLAQVPTGSTAAFIGSSGVGKSSLVNRMLGADLQTVSDVGADGKGRHTTTRREMMALPRGGWIIDTPGLREFGMLDASAGLDAVFDDIATLALQCHFRDCSHRDEPGCNVRNAVDRGELLPERYASFQRLTQEGITAAFRRSGMAARNDKQRAKSLARCQRAYSKLKRR